MLTDSDYNKIGVVLKEVSEELCEGRRFALLEGGYNHSTLGQTIKSFLKGFE
jgi:acetoin utilization deacetylase AcuC-like enzyme